MNSDFIGDIVYEDDKIVVYAEDLACHINYEENVNLYIVNENYERNNN